MKRDKSKPYSVQLLLSSKIKNGKRFNKSRWKPSVACSQLVWSFAASVDLVTAMRTELDISSGSEGERERPSERPDSGKCQTGF